MDSEQQLYTIILRHDTSTNWTINDTVLAFGEYGVEDDTHRMKRGNGKNGWSELPYENFGIEYLVTFEGIQGEVTDNKQLAEAFENTISKEDFKDVNGKILLDINIKQENNVLARLTKTTNDIINKSVEDTVLIDIISEDNSINGLWTTNEQGINVLNLTATTVLKDFSTDSEYKKDELCLFNNILYRANKDINAGEFKEEDWISLNSTHAQDIEYNPKDTELKSTTVQDAISEISEKIKDMEEQDDLIII